MMHKLALKNDQFLVCETQFLRFLPQLVELLVFEQSSPDRIIEIL